MSRLKRPSAGLIYLIVAGLTASPVLAADWKGVTATIDAKNETFDDGASYVKVENKNHFEVEVKIHLLGSGAHGCALEKDLSYRLAPGGSETTLVQLCPTGWIAMNRRTLQIISVERVVPDPPPAEPEAPVQSHLQPIAKTPSLDRQQVRLVQLLLTELGYSPGSADGIVGTTPNSKTRAAIRYFQHTHNLPVTGDASPKLLEVLTLVRDMREMPLYWFTVNMTAG